MDNAMYKGEKTTVSSGHIIVRLVPGLMKLGVAVMKHPGSAVKMMSEAQGAKRRLREKYQSRQLLYEIPPYHDSMYHPVSDRPYLRPSRNIESNTSEIIAMAYKLGAFQKTDRELANNCFDFVKKKVWFTFAAQMRGAVGTLKTGEAICLDKTNLFIALCRAGGIPGRFRLAQEAFSQNIYTELTERDPIMKEWYNSTGYFVLHAMAEAFVDGEWVPADFSMDYHFEAALGLPLSRLGDEPEGTWNWALPGSVVRCEELPPFFTFMTATMLKFNTTMMLTLQEQMETEGIELGKKALEEAGGEEAYDRKIRQTYKAKLPEVSKKLFKALNGVEKVPGDSDEQYKSLT